MVNRHAKRDLRWSDLTPAQQAAVRRRRAWTAGRRSHHAPRPRPDDGRSRLWRARRKVFLVTVAVFALLATGLYNVARRPLPKATTLSQTTFVYDDAGHPLTSYQVQNRINVPLSKVPPILIDAVVSTEDRHFFSEGAIDPLGILRALVSDVRGSGNLQGASTITQQYVKQAYLSSQRTLGRKVQEAQLAVKLGHKESKDQILDGYLNTIYLGRQAYGVQAAARAYFGKDVTQLDLAQASLLAGLIREPENADPAKDPAVARRHQTETLNDMVRDSKITPADAAHVERTPMSSYVIKSTQAAAAPPKSDLPGDQYFLAAVHNQLVAAYGAPLVDGGGLQVTTTLDPTLQAQAYNSIYGPNQPQLNPGGTPGDPAGALVSIDNGGRVRAMVGGQDYSTSQVNLAMGTAGGGSGRQPGSTFKAFMLAEVLKEGYTPTSTFPAPGEVIVPHGNADGSPWSVTNFEGEASSTDLNLVDATAQSVNTVFAQIVERIGPQNLDAMAEACGISPSELKGAFPSQVLGSADVSPLEMAAAYATFAAGGVYNAPIMFTKVTTPDGKSLPLPKRITGRQVLSPQVDAELTKVLQQVVVGTNGTGGAAGGVGSPVAGKTGTTDNSANAWFIGYTPHLTTAVWMGYAQGNIPIQNFRGLKSVQGGGIPAQLWHDYMVQALKSEPSLAGPFPTVYNYTGRTLDPPNPSTLQLIQNPTTTTVPGSPTTATGGSSSSGYSSSSGSSGSTSSGSTGSRSTGSGSTGGSGTSSTATSSTGTTTTTTTRGTSSSTRSG
ncbi:MAG: transglycosylase domain-containing protein [Actinomycetota bacterium]|nr:transglycosylase domain-containing protein [Actinomycetota bacterium]